MINQDNETGTKIEEKMLKSFEYPNKAERRQYLRWINANLLLEENQSLEIWFWITMNFSRHSQNKNHLTSKSIPNCAKANLIELLCPLGYIFLKSSLIGLVQICLLFFTSSSSSPSFSFRNKYWDELFRFFVVVGSAIGLTFFVYFWPRINSEIFPGFWLSFLSFSLCWSANFFSLLQATYLNKFLS